jgi:hypothetical protein
MTKICDDQESAQYDFHFGRLAKEDYREKIVSATLNLSMGATFEAGPA